MESHAYRGNLPPAGWRMLHPASRSRSPVRRDPSTEEVPMNGRSSVQAFLDIAQVTPAPAGAGAGASGKFTATLEGSILRYTLSFNGLSGVASSAEIRGQLAIAK